MENLGSAPFFFCSECPKTTPPISIDHIARHFQTEHKLEILICETCKVVFKNYTGFSLHLRRHQYRFFCACGSGHLHKSDFRKHLRGVKEIHHEVPEELWVPNGKSRQSKGSLKTCSEKMARAYYEVMEEHLASSQDSSSSPLSHSPPSLPRPPSPIPCDLPSRASTNLKRLNPHTNEMNLNDDEATLDPLESEDCLAELLNYSPVCHSHEISSITSKSVTEITSPSGSDENLFQQTFIDTSKSPPPLEALPFFATAIWGANQAFK